MAGSSGTWGIGGVRCKIKPGWKGAGRQGDAFLFFTDNKEQWWVALQWDDEDDPDIFKADGLLFKHLGDRFFKAERIE